MTRTEQDIVIVGGGIAAVRCAQSLRDHGHIGRLTLLTEETEHPYDRPPLSKAMLESQEPRDPVRVLPPEMATTLDIDVRLGHRATAVDTGRRLVTVAGQDEPIGYDSLVIATGTRARALPVLTGLAGVHHLRTADDARAIRDALRPGAALTIVGAGFIGLEVASAARAHGCAVTVVEIAEHPLDHVLGDRLATWLQQWHADRGVTFLCGVMVDHASSENGTVTVTLDDGTDVVSDAVVVGVGVHRDVDWMSTSGIDTHVGLVCDAEGRTSVDGVFGAGDVVCVHRGDSCSPVQHWTAATESGRTVARAVLGLDAEPCLDERYFWSDQAGLRLMSVGGRTAGAELEIVAGDLAAGTFVAHWTEGDRVVGVLGANKVKDFLQGRLAFRAALESAVTADAG
jgi:3-phenylpropionate/trans-cinnamate dioxygenase ferredoxin reductase subunit